MKKILLYLVGSLLFIACSGGGDGDGSTPFGSNEYLNVQNVEVPGGNTTATLNIQASNNCEWTITWTESWIRSISPASGRGSQNATITMTTNPSSNSSRTAVVTVSNKGGTITRNINVTQSPNAESLELSVTSLTFTKVAGNQNVTVTSNTHWTVTGGASWLSLSKSEGDGNGVVTVNVQENTTESERSSILTFRGTNGSTKQLTVTQTGRSSDFSVSTTNISAEATANTVTFNIVSEARWTTQSSQGWAKLSDVSGEGSKTIMVTLTDNVSEQSRTAEITISSSSKSEKVTITQAAGSKPTISDVVCSNTTQTSTTISFKCSSMFPVTEYGVCYSTTNNNPTTNDHVVRMQAGSVKEGSPTIDLSGLSAGTTYYVRAYATNDVGTQYSATVIFTTVSNLPGRGDNITPDV